MNEEKSSKLYRFLLSIRFPLILAAIAIVIALGGDWSRDLLRFSRSDIAAGEIWRIFTGNITHLGWSHLGLNFIGMTIMWTLVGSVFADRVWAISLAIMCVTTGSALYLFSQDLNWYVGLSGVLYGMLLMGAVPLAVRLEPDGIFILILIMAKLIIEQIYGEFLGTAEMAGGTVIVDSHWFGGLSGLVLGTLLYSKAHLPERRRKDSDTGEAARSGTGVNDSD